MYLIYAQPFTSPAREGLWRVLIARPQPGFLMSVSIVQWVSCGVLGLGKVELEPPFVGVGSLLLVAGRSGSPR